MVNGEWHIDVGNRRNNAVTISITGLIGDLKLQACWSFGLTYFKWYNCLRAQRARLRCASIFSSYTDERKANG
jgi:hypothetical protein